jgi:uncharacterized protein (TIGR02757 family)
VADSLPGVASRIEKTAAPDRPRKDTINLDAIYNREKQRLSRTAQGDPVEFLQRYRDPKDMEIAGFLASQFAYGRIDIFKRFLGELFDSMGESPGRFVEAGDFSRLRGLYYRFHKDGEIIDLFGVLRRVAQEYGGIGEMMRRFYRGDVREAIWSIRDHVMSADGKKLLFFFPKRLKANPLKRWNLYLRWMVREDEIDVGLWDFIDRADLTIPLDTHIFKIGRCQGWTDQRSPSWKAAREITEALKEHCPEDPLKYDLFLCHHVGIDAGCSGRRTPACEQKCLLVKDQEG